ncbi:hypothetical protein MCOL_V200810 [Mycobacterium colombiense CECT 3035]|uniref:Uncharacterized protein n=1 Tax=Mycobacterium colombiense CECT 3035 TaxID=1041522 RepID=J4SK48_9MYCO|nr:hypothetical protein MCOL_V200810 [Mycobacterium colombiense CECT 3035]
MGQRSVSRRRPAARLDGRRGPATRLSRRGGRFGRLGGFGRLGNSRLFDRRRLGLGGTVRQWTIRGPRRGLARRPRLALRRGRRLGRLGRLGGGRGRLRRRFDRRWLRNLGRFLQAFQRIGSTMPYFAQLGERSARKGERRHVEDRFSERFGGIFAPLVPVRDVLTQRLPGLGDSGPSVGPQADERPGPGNHAAHGLAVTLRVKQRVELADVVQTFDEIPTLDADPFECLAHLIERPADWCPV